MMKYLTIPFLFLILLTSCEEEDTKRIVKYNPNDSINYVGDNLYDSLMYYQFDYILGNQLINGAFTDTRIEGSRVCPYFANFAALALLTDPTDAHVESVKKWVDWYLNHLNDSYNVILEQDEIAGSIYDYSYPNLEETTSGTYDSVDSYAATFLMLIRRLLEVSPESEEWLVINKSRIRLVASAMEDCLDTPDNTVPKLFSEDDNDGLSIASRVWPAKYLMDNTEVNKGLRDWLWLENNFFYEGNAVYVQELLENNTEGIEREFWDDDSYLWYEGSTSPADWSKGYPDVMAQVFPMRFGVIDIDGDRANYLYTKACSVSPDWSAGEDEVFDGTTACITAAVINDKVKVDEYIRYVLYFNAMGAQRPDWILRDAANTILAADLVQEQINEKPYSPIVQ